LFWRKPTVRKKENLGKKSPHLSGGRKGGKNEEGGRGEGGRWGQGKLLEKLKKSCTFPRRGGTLGSERLGDRPYRPKKPKGTKAESPLGKKEEVQKG